MKIKIFPNGTVQFIYSDKLRGLMNVGKSEIKRASHVEPTSDGRWTADLGPSSGPVMGPFETRSEALMAEAKWIEENIL